MISKSITCAWWLDIILYNIKFIISGYSTATVSKNTDKKIYDDKNLSILHNIIAVHRKIMFIF